MFSSSHVLTHSRIEGRSSHSDLNTHMEQYNSTYIALNVRILLIYLCLCMFSSPLLSTHTNNQFVSISSVLSVLRGGTCLES